jgi:hypothetical protein
MKNQKPRPKEKEPLATPYLSTLGLALHRLPPMYDVRVQRHELRFLPEVLG